MSCRQVLRSRRLTNKQKGTPHNWLLNFIDSSVELLLIYNDCLCLFCLLSKLNSPPRFCPLGTTFLSLLDPLDRKTSAGIHTSHHILKRYSLQRHQLSKVLKCTKGTFSTTKFGAFSQTLDLKQGQTFHCMPGAVHFLPLMVVKLGSNRDETDITCGSQICASMATCLH